MRKDIKFICKKCKFKIEETIFTIAGYDIVKNKALKHLDDKPKHILKRVK